MVEIKTPAEIEAMRGAGRVVAQILAAVQDQAKAGMRTAELDEVAMDVLARAGAYSPFLNYQPGFAPIPFPATICTSVNDAALHGIPGRYKLADGDLLSVDCGAVLDGWTGDAAVSFTIGTPRPADRRLIDVTRDALRASLEGRSDDLFRYAGASVHPFVIGAPLLQVPAVREFQVRQTELGADIAAVIDGDFDHAAVTAE
ncbi:MAG: M24 family metallopeptidase, partial [Streptosporangiales bacterium]